MRTDKLTLGFAYLRLSNEEAQGGESSSITNQRMIVQNYCKQNGITLVREFVDDGYSGGNFDRPAFQEMMRQLSQGKANTVITKDLSRLGRNHLDTDDLLGMVFPFLQIRFISLNDMYDSALQVYGTAGDIDTGMRNIINQMYSQDLSQKVKLAKKQYAKRGQSTAAYCSFGYMKSPEDKHRRIPDPEAAEVVRKIFEWCIAGKGTAQIANLLNAEGVPTPTQRKRQLGARRKKWNSERENNEWSRGQILRILRDEQYTGKLIAGKTERRVLGDASSSRRCDPSEWVVIPDAFEGIITQEQFDAAQRQLAQSRGGKTASKAEPGQRKRIHAGTCRARRKSHPLFYRKLKCGICGLAPVRKRAARPYYQCGAGHEQRRGL